MIKFFLLLHFLICTSAFANIAVKDKESENPISISGADVDRVTFTFYFDPGRNSPAVDCSFDGASGITALESKGFHLGKLPGIPACIVAGNFEIHLKKSRKVLGFKLLCNEIAMSDNGDTYLLRKRLEPSICKGSKKH